MGRLLKGLETTERLLNNCCTAAVQLLEGCCTVAGRLLNGCWEAGNTAVSTKEIRSQWSMKNVRDMSESQKQVDWKITNKLISPLQQH